MDEKHQITTSEYLEKLNLVKNLVIKDIYHTQDSMLCLDIIGQESENRKFRITLDGDWKLIKANDIIGTSDLENGESDHSYYEKLRKMASELKNKVHKIEAIEYFEADRILTIHFDENFKIEVSWGKFGLLSLKNETENYYLISSKDSDPIFFIEKI